MTYPPPLPSLRTTLMLRNLGLHAIPLHGKMSQVISCSPPAASPHVTFLLNRCSTPSPLPQAKRLGSLNKFKSKSRPILIATDVASRGLDIPHVDVVINFDIPTHSKVRLLSN